MDNSTEEKKVTYCGNGIKKSDTWLKVSIHTDKIAEYIKTYNGVKYVSLNINIASEPNKYGKDVILSVDEWHPIKK